MSAQATTPRSGRPTEGRGAKKARGRGVPTPAQGRAEAGLRGTQERLRECARLGRAVSGYFPKLRATARLPPWSSESGPGGPGPGDRALTWGGSADGRREPGPGLRGAPRPLLPGLRGLPAQPALRFQQRFHTEGQRAGPRAVPATRPQPRGVHDERRGGHARAGGRGARRRNVQQRASRLPGAWRPRPPCPIKRRRPFHEPLSNCRSCFRVDLGVHWLC